MEMPEAPDTAAPPPGLEEARCADADERRGARSPLALDLAVAVLLFAALAALLVPLAITVIKPQPIAGLPGFSQRQRAETGVYVLLVGLGIPLAVSLGPRWAQLVARNRGASAWREVAAWTLLLAIPVVAFRALSTRSIGGDPGLLAASVAAWWLALGVRVARLKRTSGTAHAAGPTATAIGGRLLVAGGLGLPCFLYPLLFARSGALRLFPLALAVVGAAAAVLVARGVRARTLSGSRIGLRVFSERSAARRVLDLAAVVVLAACSVNIVVVEPGGAGRPLDQRFYDQIVSFHANFLLGPANQLAHGGTMLVDTVSQYGVGSIVALSGVLDLVGSGYGAVGLFDGLLTAFAVIAAWLILRTAGVRLLISVLALAFVVVVLLWGRAFPVGTIVQDGAFRTGITPWVIVGWLVSRRSRTLGDSIVGVAIAASAIWSFEVLALTSVTWLVLVASEAWAAPPDARRSIVVRGALLYAAPAVAALALFALWTEARSGQLPDWRFYADFLRAFFVGQLREVTYDFTRWSPGIGLGGVYLAQAVALGVLLTRWPPLARSLGDRLPVLCALAVFGLACFFYLVDRSLDHVVIYVAQPLVLSTAIWLDEIVRAGVIRWRASVGLAISAWVLLVAALSLAAVWPKIRSAARDTLAWQAMHGPQRVADRWQRLRHFPPFDPQAENGAELLRTHLKDTSSVLVIMSPDRAVETLARAEKRNRLPLSFSLSDSFIAQEPGARMRRLVEQEIRRVHDGDIALVDRETLLLMRLVRRGRELALPRAISVDKLRVEVFTSLGRRFKTQVLARRGDTYLVRLQS